MNDLMNRARENLKDNSKKLHFSLTKRCGEERVLQLYPDRFEMKRQ